MVARDANVRELILGHLNPAYDEARLERMRFDAARIFPRTHLADDFRTFDVRAADADDEAASAAAVAADEEPAS
jgi:hypothetical protein